MSLVEKIRKARETNVEIGGFTFTVRRPTDVEWGRLAASGAKVSDLMPFITGWSGVREIDIIPGGNPMPVDFDEALMREWLADRLDLLHPLLDAIRASYEDRARALEGAAKN